MGLVSTIFTWPLAPVRGLVRLAELTAKETQGVTPVEPSDGGWLVNVEVVEDRRDPLVR